MNWRSFGIVERTVTADTDPNYVIVTEYLLPDERGPYMLLERDKEVEWVVRRYVEQSTGHPERSDD